MKRFNDSMICMRGEQLQGACTLARGCLVMTRKRSRPQNILRKRLQKHGSITSHHQKFKI
jgi:hypothetical protein